MRRPWPSASGPSGGLPSLTGSVLPRGRPPTQSRAGPSALVRRDPRRLGPVQRLEERRIEGEEGLGGAWIELDAGVAGDLRPRLLDRLALAIGAVAGDGVERVRDGEDPRAERDLLAGEPARITRSVPALLVGQHDLGWDLEERDGLQDRVTGRGVLAHLLPLGGEELAGLEQDGVRDADLPDVVQQGAARDVGPVGG